MRLPATLREKFFNQSFTALLNEVEYQLKILRLALIWIGHFSSRALLHIVEQQRNFLGKMVGAKCFQMLNVVFIHCHQMVEVREIGGHNFPRTQRGEIVTTSCGMLDGTRVGWSPDMKTMGTGRINFELAGQAFFTGNLAKHRFERGVAKR